MSTLIILIAVNFFGQTSASMVTGSHLKPTAERLVPKPTRSDATGILQTASPNLPLTKLDISTSLLSTSEISPFGSLEKSVTQRTSSQAQSYRRSEHTPTPLTSPNMPLFTALEQSITSMTSLKPISYSQLKLITTPLASSETSRATASEHSILPTKPINSLAYAKLDLITTQLTSPALSLFTTLEHRINCASSVHPLSFTTLELIDIKPTPCQTLPFTTLDFSATTSTLLTSLSYIKLEPSTIPLTELDPVSFTSIWPIATPLSLLLPVSFITIKTEEAIGNPSTLLKPSSYTVLEQSATSSSLHVPLPFKTVKASGTPSTTLKLSSYTTLEPSATQSALETSVTRMTSIQSYANPRIQEICSNKYVISGDTLYIDDLPCSIPVNVTNLWLPYNSLQKEFTHIPTNIPGSENVTKVTFFRRNHYEIVPFLVATSSSLYCSLTNLFPAVHIIEFRIEFSWITDCSWPSVTDISMWVSNSIEIIHDMVHFTFVSYHIQVLVLYNSYLHPTCQPESIYMEINMDILQDILGKLEILKVQYMASCVIRFFDNGYCKRNSTFKSVYFDNFFTYDLTIIDETRCKYKSIEFNYTVTISRIFTDPGINIKPLYIIGFNTVIFHDVDYKAFKLGLNHRAFWEGLKRRQHRRFGVHIFFSYDSRLIVTSNKIKIFKFYSQQNKLIRYLFTIMNFPYIRELDFSSYKITYLSFTSFVNTHSFISEDLYLLKEIQNLSLANNELGSMSDQHKEDWSSLFHIFPLLSRLDLSTNGIFYLPKNIFTFNPNLTNIKLTRNKLKYIPVGVFNKLRHLEVLDISFNNIKLINMDVRQGLTLLASLNNKFGLNISGNVLECTCIDLDTYTWISDTRKSGYLDFNGSTCLTEDNILLKLNLVEKYCSHQEFLQTIRYCTGISGGIISLMMIIVILVWRLHKRQRKIAKYLNDVKQKRTKKEYVLFLSHCSRDIDLVYREILPNIQRHLIDRTHIDREYICTGDLHFKPGFNIIQEAIRCIDLCSVVVFVISKAFVASPYCRMEVKETLDRAKPVILIMKDKIQQHKLPRIIKNLFYKNVRFHLVQCDHAYQVTPSWKRLVDAILELAANEEQDIETLELLREDNNIDKNPDNGIEMAVFR